jgi:hypothetical protein
MNYKVHRNKFKQNVQDLGKMARRWMVNRDSDEKSQMGLSSVQLCPAQRWLLPLTRALHGSSGLSKLLSNAVAVPGAAAPVSASPSSKAVPKPRARKDESAKPSCGSSAVRPCVRKSRRLSAASNELA